MPSQFGEGGKASFNEALTKEDYMGEGLNKGRTKRSRKLSGCPSSVTFGDSFPR